MSSFALDKSNARIMGVCSGLARSTGIDLTLIRVVAVLVTLAVSGITLPLYLIAGLVAPQR
ncbi:PspC domain-containing protein [Sphingomonas parva]|uniref:PspC domain-containing protein n=1 Tax=Sphingomonas parva TaxID=2555898 RepID=A0A4Y8ZTU8_9SPHN|nr:PspC domain-containing protein [Sphingomonas parva]TFI59468.1 PspC domain-containing protein [Sphingomonas parva]